MIIVDCCMGSATLYHLAKKGLKVCGIDRFEIANDCGSSHGRTRIIRKTYFEDPQYLPLLDRAYELRPWLYFVSLFTFHRK